MATEYRYPDENSPSVSWLPTVCPLLDSSDQAEDDGIMRKRATGGRPVLYQFSNPTEVITHAFRIPWSEVIDESTGWRVFRDAIQGRQFRAKDDMIGEFVDVVLWRSPTWKPISSNGSGVSRVEGTIVLLRKVP